MSRDQKKFLEQRKEKENDLFVVKALMQLIQCLPEDSRERARVSPRYWLREFSDASGRLAEQDLTRELGLTDVLGTVSVSRDILSLQQLLQEDISKTDTWQRFIRLSRERTPWQAVSVLFRTTLRTFWVLTTMEWVITLSDAPKVVLYVLLPEDLKNVTGKSQATLLPLDTFRKAVL